MDTNLLIVDKSFLYLLNCNIYRLPGCWANIGQQRLFNLRIVFRPVASNVVLSYVLVTSSAQLFLSLILALSSCRKSRLPTTLFFTLRVPTKDLYDTWSYFNVAVDIAQNKAVAIYRYCHTVYIYPCTKQDNSTSTLSKHVKKH